MNDDKLMSLVIYGPLLIIPALVLGLFWGVMVGGLFFKKYPLWKKLLYPSIMAVVISGIIFPIMIFAGIMHMPLGIVGIICIVYTVVSAKTLYNNDWKNYK